MSRNRNHDWTSLITPQYCISWSLLDKECFSEKVLPDKDYVSMRWTVFLLIPWCSRQVGFVPRREIERNVLHLLRGVLNRCFLAPFLQMIRLFTVWNNNEDHLPRIQTEALSLWKEDKVRSIQWLISSINFNCNAAVLCRKWKSLEVALKAYIQIFLYYSFSACDATRNDLEKRQKILIRKFVSQKVSCLKNTSMTNKIISAISLITETQDL